MTTCPAGVVALVVPGAVVGTALLSGAPTPVTLTTAVVPVAVTATLAAPRRTVDPTGSVGFPSKPGKPVPAEALGCASRLYGLAARRNAADDDSGRQRSSDSPLVESDGGAVLQHEGVPGGGVRQGHRPHAAAARNRRQLARRAGIRRLHCIRGQQSRGEQLSGRLVWHRRSLWPC